jgi:AAA family ATP:ADP antiporter
MFLIIGLTLIWGYVVFKLRIQYFLSFKNNLQAIVKTDKRTKPMVTKESFLNGMLRVLKEGNEREILYMLNKTLEINDERLLEPISKLLDHPSKAVKLAVIQNLYFIDNKSIHLEVKTYLNSNDKELVIATLEYLLQHADQNEEIIYDEYLNSENVFISNAALICLAKETRDNPKLRQIYNLESRIEEKIKSLNSNENNTLNDVIQIIGFAEYKNQYGLIFNALTNTESDLQKEAIEAASHTMDSRFIDPLLEKLTDKKLREIIIHSLLFYGEGLIPVVFDKLKDGSISIEVRNMIPRVIEAFNSQQAVDTLIDCFIVSDELSIRLASVSCLTRLKEKNLGLDFKQNVIANLILEECRLYNSTIDAMHTQIIIHYLRRKKIKFEDEQMSARKSLLEILERRLYNGLNRIFKLLELRFSQNDIRMAYNGITSGEAEDIVNAIEFLDIILNPNLKSVLIPIVEASALDIASEELIDTIGKNRITEYDCFKNILLGKDTRLKIAVLFLISKTQDQNYLELLLNLKDKVDTKLNIFVEKAIFELQEKI